ncbi:hypothetical protein GVv1_47590 (plasmid) [Enterobacter pseudoroggenkampii]
MPPAIDSYRSALGIDQQSFWCRGEFKSVAAAQRNTEIAAALSDRKMPIRQPDFTAVQYPAE